MPVTILNSRIFGSLFEHDARNFLDAAGITSANKRYAANTIINTLKRRSLWKGWTAIYPIMGGTTDSDSYNMINPSLYKITWTVDPTHSENGVQYNGSTMYGNTGIPNNALSQNDNHISLYSRTNDASTVRDMGVRSPVFWTIELYGSVFYSSNCTATTSYLISGATRTDGLFINTRTGASAMASTRNGADLATGSATSTTPGTAQFYIGAINDNGSPSHFTSKQHSWYSFGPGLSSADMTNFYNAVQAFQISLGRAV